MDHRCLFNSFTVKSGLVVCMSILVFSLAQAVSAGELVGEFQLAKVDCLSKSAPVPPSSTCGNGILDIDAGEQCDGDDVGGMTCFHICQYIDCPIHDYDNGGPITCNPDCTWNPDQCGYCGDGIQQGAGGEECDGNDFGGKTCESFPGGSASGIITCDDHCQIDVTQCSACGNGVLDRGEECDWNGQIKGGQTCESLGGYANRSVYCERDCTLAIEECCDVMYFLENCTGSVICDDVSGAVRDCVPDHTVVPWQCVCTINEEASRVACDQIPGCTWNSATETCEGTLDCSDLNGRSTTDTDVLRRCSCDMVERCIGPDGHDLFE